MGPLDYPRGEHAQDAYEQSLEAEIDAQRAYDLQEFVNEQEEEDI
jgi:hypothetical protein